MRSTVLTTIGAALSAAAVAAGVAWAADGNTERVSVGPAAVQATDLSANPSLSAQGRHVAFASLAPNLVAGDTNGVRDVFIRDRQTNVTERASVSATGGQANGVSTLPAVSADGRQVAFESSRGQPRRR